MSGVSSHYHLSLGTTPPRLINRVGHRANLSLSDAHCDWRNGHKTIFIWMVHVSRLFYREFERNAQDSAREQATFQLNGSAARARIDSVDGAKWRWLGSCQPEHRENQTTDRKWELPFLVPRP